ncbi:MAG: hypothetical protein ABIT71_26225 [Vicinamibacteraceae bacterium]
MRFLAMGFNHTRGDTAAFVEPTYGTSPRMAGPIRAAYAQAPQPQ